MWTSVEFWHLCGETNQRTQSTQNRVQQNRQRTRYSHHPLQHDQERKHGMLIERSHTVVRQTKNSLTHSITGSSGSIHWTLSSKWVLYLSLLQSAANQRQRFAQQLQVSGRINGIHIRVSERQRRSILDRSDRCVLSLQRNDSPYRRMMIWSTNINGDIMNTSARGSSLTLKAWDGWPLGLLLSLRCRDAVWCCLTCLTVSDFICFRWRYSDLSRHTWESSKREQNSSYGTSRTLCDVVMLRCYDDVGHLFVSLRQLLPGIS